jgi:hypothetical protein
MSGVGYLSALAGRDQANSAATLHPRRRLFGHGAAFAALANRSARPVGEPEDRPPSAQPAATGAPFSGGDPPTQAVKSARTVPDTPTGRLTPRRRLDPAVRAPVRHHAAQGSTMEELGSGDAGPPGGVSIRPRSMADISPGTTSGTRPGDSPPTDPTGAADERFDVHLTELAPPQPPRHRVPTRPGNRSRRTPQIHVGTIEVTVVPPVVAPPQAPAPTPSRRAPRAFLTTPALSGPSPSGWLGMAQR